MMKFLPDSKFRRLQSKAVKQDINPFITRKFPAAFDKRVKVEPKMGSAASPL